MSMKKKMIAFLLALMVGASSISLGNSQDVYAENINQQTGITLATTQLSPKVDTLQDTEDGQVYSVFYYDNSQTKWDNVYAYVWGNGKTEVYEGNKVKGQI